MDKKSWDSLNKIERGELLKKGGLPTGLSQLSWSGLQKSERTKLEKAMKSKGKGWHEQQEEVRTEKGIEKKAPIHREVAIKKEASEANNKPMQKATHTEQAQEFDWTKIHSYPNLKHVYLGQHGVFEKLEGKDKERFIKALSEDVAENGSWEKAEENAREFFKTKGAYYDEKGNLVEVSKVEQPTVKEESLKERLIGQGADLKGVGIDQIEDYIHPRTKAIVKRYKLRLTDGAFSGKSAYRCPEDDRALYVWVAGEGTEHLHLACEMGHAATFDKAIDLRKIGKDKETTKWAKKAYAGWLAEAKEEGFDTVVDYYNSADKNHSGEYTKLGVGLEKIFHKDAAKAETEANKRIFKTLMDWLDRVEKEIDTPQGREDFKMAWETEYKKLYDALPKADQDEIFSRLNGLTTYAYYQKKEEEQKKKAQEVTKLTDIQFFKLQEKYPLAMEYFIGEIVKTPYDTSQVLIKKINEWAEEESQGTKVDLLKVVYDEKWFKDYQERAQKERIEVSPTLKYLFEEFEKRNKALDSTPIRLEAKNDKIIQEAIEFAMDYPPRIELLFKSVDIQIRYGNRDDNGKPRNLELGVFDKKGEELYHNRDYDMNLTPEEVKRVAKSFDKQKPKGKPASEALITLYPEEHYFGTEVTIVTEEGIFDYTGKILRLLNGGTLAEVRPSGDDFAGSSFRVPVEQVYVNKVIENPKEHPKTEPEQKPSPKIAISKTDFHSVYLVGDIKDRSFVALANIIVTEDGRVLELPGMDYMKGRDYPSENFNFTTVKEYLEDLKAKKEEVKRKQQEEKEAYERKEAEIKERLSKPPSGYFIHKQDENGDPNLEPVTGKVYPFEHQGIDLFAFKDTKGWNTRTSWNVSERHTGLFVSGGRTKVEAIQKAKEYIDKKGAGEVKRQIKVALGKMGVK